MVNAVYHWDCCSRCGQLGVEYSGKVNISVDKIFLFKLFFLGFFSSLSTQYLLQYIRIFKHSKWFKDILLHKDIQHFWHPPSCSSGWMRKHAFMSIFVVGHQRIILTRVLPIGWANALHVSAWFYDTVLGKVVVWPRLSLSQSKLYQDTGKQPRKCYNPINKQPPYIYLPVYMTGPISGQYKHSINSSMYVDVGYRYTSGIHIIPTVLYNNAVSSVHKQWHSVPCTPSN